MCLIPGLNLALKKIVEDKGRDQQKVLQVRATYLAIRGALVLVNVCKCLPDKAGHGHHARMLPPKNLAVFALVWFKVVVQPPL